jgi:Flp pilus assembly protein TadG
MTHDNLRRADSGQMRWSRVRAWLRGLRDDSGNSLIEVALLFSFVGMPLLLGTMELGFLVYDSIEVSNAAYAGAMFGMQSSTFAAETSTITSVAQAEATDFGTALTATPTTYYACSLAVSGTQYSTQSAANTGCTGTGNHALQFVQVTTSVTVTPPIHWPKLPSTFTLHGLSIQEVEQ